MKSILKLVLVAIILTLLASPTSALAQDDTPGRAGRGGIRGDVTAVGDDNLTVSTPNGQSVTVHVSNETKIRLVETQSQGTLADIELGNFVGARGQKNDDGSLNARFIVVLPQNPRDLARTHGKVTAINGDVITLENRQGDTQDVTTDENTRFRIGKEPGSLDDINVGDPVLAIGVKQDDGTFLAKLVAVVTRRQLRRHILRGEVLDKDIKAGTLTVQPRGDQEKAWLVKTTDQTKYRVSGIENPTLEDVEVGAHVFIIGRPDNNDDDETRSGTARVIAVIPERLQDMVRLRGEVTDINEPEFILNTNRGKFTIVTDESTRYRTRGDEAVSFEDIEEGMRVIVIGKKVEDQDNTVQAKVVGIPLSNTNDN